MIQLIVIDQLWHLVRYTIRLDPEASEICTIIFPWGKCSYKRLTSDRVHRWRLLLEEYAPEIVYIKGTHSTVADAISRLEYNPKLNSTNEYNHAMQS